MAINGDKPQGHQAGHGHETSDAKAGWIFSIVLGLFITGLAIHFLIAGLLNVLNRTTPPHDAWLRAAQPQIPRVPGNARFPALQINPPVDLLALRRRDQAALNTYAWVNRTSGIVRIPIARAMELLAQRGLPGTNRAAGVSSLQLQQQRVSQPHAEVRR